MPTDRTNLALDLADCPCSGGTLDKLIQPAVLIVLAEGPLHGYRLAERIGTMPTLGGQKPDVSGVYPSAENDGEEGPGSLVLGHLGKRSCQKGLPGNSHGHGVSAPMDQRHSKTTGTASPCCSRRRAKRPESDSVIGRSPSRAARASAAQRFLGICLPKESNWSRREVVRTANFLPPLTLVSGAMTG